MADQPLSPVTMYGVRLLFRNFRGEEGKFNEEGERTFAVLLDPETASAMARDEWNVKYLNPRDEEEEENPQAYLPIRARWDKGRPPTIYVITHHDDEMYKRGPLEESEVEMLDWAELINVDMIVKPSRWNIEGTGKSGVKAYLTSLYATIEEDPLQAKYREAREQR